jgi:UDP-N-acetyl-D-galactosamine dehydrogenase
MVTQLECILWVQEQLHEFLLIITMNQPITERIAVLGLGYVGLPLALALAEKFSDVVGFDISSARVNSLRSGIDNTHEVDPHRLRATTLRLSDNLLSLEDRSFFIVCVPTPVDQSHQPNLVPLLSASHTVGKVIKPGAIVVYESTVYPGVTEDVCGPAIAKVSGLKQGIDFFLGYSPERINPGDKLHTLEKITKVIAAENSITLERLAYVYGSIIEAGLHQAPSIQVAEMAKVIENAQRDLNIAFMNELALICDRLGIRTHDVLKAAQTKWNFLPFTPGLVGGHCIGVDPYYLTAKAEELGYHSQVILAGRHINDGMGAYLAERFTKLLIKANLPIRGIRIAVLGLTFKENVSDLRNSRVPDILKELREFGIYPLVHDPLANVVEVQQEYGVELADWESLTELDGLILAVNHQFYLDIPQEELLDRLNQPAVLMDVKSVLDPHKLPQHINYWSL